jgi:DNA polymerase III epsilon subunit-like protein
MCSIMYYIIDIESSGLSSIYHEPTEISIIRCVDRVQLTRMIKCKYPKRANADALRITGKTIADLYKGDDLSSVVEECDKFLKEDNLTRDHRCIVGHNIITFDKKFLHVMWASVGKEFPCNLYLDTIPLTKEFAKREGIKTRKFNLQASCDMVGIKKFAEAHGAKVDTRNNYLLWKALVEDKKIDYLPLIKNIPHYLNNEISDKDLELLNDD